MVEEYLAHVAHGSSKELWCHSSARRPRAGRRPARRADGDEDRRRRKSTALRRLERHEIRREPSAGPDEAGERANGSGIVSKEEPAAALEHFEQAAERGDGVLGVLDDGVTSAAAAAAGAAGGARRHGSPRKAFANRRCRGRRRWSQRGVRPGRRPCRSEQPMRSESTELMRWAILMTVMPFISARSASWMPLGDDVDGGGAVVEDEHLGLLEQYTRWRCVLLAAGECDAALGDGRVVAVRERR